MSEIRIHRLEEQLANQIAAGEVVERPGAALKELVENSLDAKATQITVKIAEGGVKLIEVHDDGIGMHNEDMLLALERHATSKIRSTDDLFAIRTWGFRGEALASIAAVSRLTLSSKNLQSLQGRELTCEGGNIIVDRPVTRRMGTSVKVENLFFNTPARKKFLKSQAAESSHCAMTFQRLALGAPAVGLELNIDDNKSYFYPPKQSHAERICSVFDAYWKTSVRDTELLEIAETRENLALRAWILPSQYFIPSSRGILTFINGRTVKDKLLQQAILTAAKEVLFGQLYPQLVLFLSMPPEWVDVNVHPTKSEVRFKEPGYVFAFVRKHVESALARHSGNLARGSIPVSGHAASEIMDRAENPVPLFMATSSFAQKPGNAALQELSESSDAQPGLMPVSYSHNSGLQFLGTVKNTYLVCQDEAGILLVDQHAAHERVTYEKLKKAKLSAIRSQPLLIPLQVELASTLLDKMEMEFAPLAALGLHLDRSGPTQLLVRELPSLLIRADGSPAFSLARFFREVAPLWDEELSPETFTERLQEKILAVLASESCHGSVRAGQTLSAREAQALFAQMESTDFSGHCPHGRPTSVRLSWNEIERLFKRVF